MIINFCKGWRFLLKYIWISGTFCSFISGKGEKHQIYGWRSFVWLLTYIDNLLPLNENLFSLANFLFPYSSWHHNHHHLQCFTHYQCLTFFTRVCHHNMTSKLFNSLIINPFWSLSEFVCTFGANAFIPTAGIPV